MLKAYTNAPSTVKTSFDNASKQVTELRTKLAGAGGGFGRGGGEGGGGFGGQQALRNRIDSLKSDVIGSQSVPTAIQANRLDTYIKELNDTIGQLNSTINSTLPSLFKQLNDNNIHPSFGEAIKPVTKP
jgi:hypothetical protein